MNKREKRYTACASIMIILLVGLIMVVSSGCATYKVTQTRTEVTGAIVETVVEATSWRNFEDLVLKYFRDDEIVEFELSAAGVETPIDAALKGVAGVASMTPVGAALKGIKMGIQVATGESAATNEKE